MPVETVRRSENKGPQASQREVQGNSEDIREDFQTLVTELGKSIQVYAKQRPGMAGLIVFGLGFYVGWKIKPW